ncbi:hypothetical protein PENTCL1PPCAC_16623 [Pristionchus entomophagus]|uniref:BZIP domain-containing protein n=1 Tax=Pristionchus entomophagus TaxID=358040 RepID=A0AAV5TJL2_9BILA|nr:hypothetical protein PENTCL1PPCAC_16623 [Pristionchus entomophagus]
MAGNRDAAYRHREKKKEEYKELQNEVPQLSAEKEYLKDQISQLNEVVLMWKRNCRKHGFIPQSTFQWMSPLASASPSQSTTSTTTGSVGSVSPLADQISLPPSKERERKRKEMQALQDNLTARNGSLRSQAHQIYNEILNLRKEMGFDGVKTTADRDLPVIHDSAQILLAQISDLISST